MLISGASGCPIMILTRLRVRPSYICMHRGQTNANILNDRNFCLISITGYWQFNLIILELANIANFDVGRNVKRGGELLWEWEWEGERRVKVGEDSPVDRYSIWNQHYPGQLI